MFSALLRDDVQEFIFQHQHKSPATIALQKSPFVDVSSQELAQQILGLQLAKQKIPSLVSKRLIYPKKIHLEQMSSEQTALYKASILSPGDRFIDLTGGFGIDTYFISNQFQNSTYCELNEELAAIVSTNFIQLNNKIKVNVVNGIDYIQTQANYDCIFIDPSRRTDLKQKIIGLEESTPNIIKHWNLLLKQSNQLLVKLSPVLDLHYLIQTLSDIKVIHVVSVKNDVKEIIILAEKDFASTVKLIAVDINEKIISYKSDFNSTNNSTNIANLKEKHFQYLYEPFGVVLKTQLQDFIGNEYHLQKLSSNSHLYLSEELLDLPLFKQFKIQKQYNFKPKQLKKELPELINVVCRNFPLKPEQVLTKLNRKQGGDKFLICSTDKNNQRICFLAKRLDVQV